MKHLKTYENIEGDFKIGDKVYCFDNYNLETYPESCQLEIGKKYLIADIGQIGLQKT